MKTLANCTFTEFLKQSNKIRKAVAEYLTETKILEIRKNLPEIPKGATDKEKEKLMIEQGKKNISDMFDRMLEEHTEATVKILGLLCFIEDEKEIEKLNPLDVFEVFFNERVINFFMQLMRSGLFNMADTSQK